MFECMSAHEQTKCFFVAKVPVGGTKALPLLNGRENTGYLVYQVINTLDNDNDVHK